MSAFPASGSRSPLWRRSRGSTELAVSNAAERDRADFPVPSQLEISTRSRFGNYGGFPMADARCSCGALALTLSEPSKLVVACHCLDCQRRTGAPFGVGAFYPIDAVAISGAQKVHPRCNKRRKGPHLLLSELRVDGLLEGRHPTVADRRCSRRAGRSKIPRPPSGRFSSSRNIVGFKLMALSNTSSKAAWQKNQAEAPSTEEVERALNS